MTLPTPDQTEDIWIARTHNDRGYHSIHDVFPNEEIDRVHRANCRLLIQMGKLRPEHEDHLPFSRRRWNPRERYYHKPF